jgi:ABC-type nickel/cobalt efflux system permease component RcnA
MTYAVSLDVKEAGLVFALAMLLGVLAVLSAVALATVYFRSSFLTWIERHGREWSAVARWIDVLAALLLISIALYELVSQPRD